MQRCSHDIVILLQDRVYESHATLYVTSAMGDDAQSAYQGSLASQQRVGSYVRLVRSDAILGAAITRSGLSVSSVDVSKDVSASTTPNTVLLTVSARNESPELASRLANGIADELVDYVRTLEVPSAGGSPLAKLTVVSPATPSADPVAPRPKLNAAVGMLVGLFVGLFAALLRDRFDSTIVRAGDVVDVADSSVVGELPSGHEQVDFEAGFSPSAEAYRKLRTNMEFANVDSSVRKILVTSAVSGEGKSTVVANLARSIADSGKSVLLIDADLRRPSIAERLHVSADFGLTDVIRSRVLLTEAVQHTSTLGLDLLASGDVPPNPAELLGSRKTLSVIDDCAARYDFVLIDSPPVLPVTDAVVLSRYVDGALMIARSGLTKAPKLSAATAQVSKESTLLGVVLNDVSGSAVYGGYNAYYS